MDYFGIPKGRNIKIKKLIFGPYLPVLKNMGALCKGITIVDLMTFFFTAKFP